jgi:2,4-dienoyl-CoA reductase (NADPH2)
MLFSPIRVGQMELKNRMVMPAMHYLNSEEGMVTPHYIDFYVERAKGGVGLIVIGGCTIDETSGATNMLSIRDDRFMPRLAALAGALKAQGAKVAVQLFHAGRYARSQHMGGRQPVSSSPIPSRITRETPRELSIQEIKAIEKNYALAAARVKQAGFDAVEVLCAAGYLISQFLSPVVNRRKDEYGGDLQNRMRFALEVVQEVRRTVGADYPLAVRLAGNEFMEGGLENNEAQAFSRELEKAGADMLSVIGGWHESGVPQISMAVPRGGFVYLAQGVKQAVSIPVMACNRINDPVLAEQILRDGRADLIAFARSLIADPELPNKARLGRLDEIRYCIGCNQGCFHPLAERKPERCLVNARAGVERKRSIEPAPRKKKVMVIGGGPAGMEAARVAALRGHEVCLYEKCASLGGQLPLAAAPPGRKEFLSFVRYLETQLRKLQAAVHTGVEVTLEDIERESPDAVILATGAEPLIPDIKGVDRPNVVLAWDVLSGKVDAGREVVIIGGGAVGLETSFLLAGKGTLDADTLYFLMFHQAESRETLHNLLYHGLKKITVLEMLEKVGQDIGPTTRWALIQDLSRLGVNMVTEARAEEIADNGVLVERAGKKAWIQADTVVLAAGAKPVNFLYEQVKSRFKEVYLIGDAKSPRNALEAVAEGLEAGRTI